MIYKPVILDKGSNYGCFDNPQNVTWISPVVKHPVSPSRELGIFVTPRLRASFLEFLSLRALRGATKDCHGGNLRLGHSFQQNHMGKEPKNPTFPGFRMQFRGMGQCLLHLITHICSMYGIFTYICPNNHPNVGKYTIHGGYWDLLLYTSVFHILGAWTSIHQKCWGEQKGTRRSGELDP